MSGSILLMGATFVIYFTVRSAPGDAVDAITPMGTPEEVKGKLKKEFGLDKDPFNGYIVWLSNSIKGDFGDSLAFSPGEKVATIILPAFKNTLILSLITLLSLLIIILIIVSIFSESGDRMKLFSIPFYFLTSAPSFVFAIIFAQFINIIVHNYWELQNYETPNWYPIPIYTESIMPYVFASFSLMMGDGLFVDLFNSIRSEYTKLKNIQFIAAIKSKGASTMKHISKNMVVPILSNIESRLPLILGSVVIVEYIFTLNGAGYLLLEAAKSRDFPIVVGLSTLFTITVIILNVIVNIVKSIIDPREVTHGG